VAYTAVEYCRREEYQLGSTWLVREIEKMVFELLSECLESGARGYTRWKFIPNG
jgi:hypothetical protein